MYFIGHTRACEIKGAGAGTVMAAGVAYYALLFLSGGTFFEGVARSPDGQKGKNFPFESLKSQTAKILNKNFVEIEWKKFLFYYIYLTLLNITT